MLRIEASSIERLSDAEAAGQPWLLSARVLGVKASGSLEAIGYFDDWSKMVNLAWCAASDLGFALSCHSRFVYHFH